MEEPWKVDPTILRVLDRYKQDQKELRYFGFLLSLLSSSGC